jgi:FAD/FMN-containing dehydrogenase
MTSPLARRALLAAAGGLLSPPSRAAATPSDAAWRSLATAGTVLRPGMDGFAAAVRPQNLRYGDVVPQALLRCASPEGLAHALRWAQDHAMPFVLRSGGHSYAGASTTTGLLIDMRRLNDVRAGADGLVRLGGGVNNGEVYAALRARGLSLTHGRCLEVGASAFLMGGGIGFAMRDRGMGCDAVISADILLADGSVRRASATDDADLFWALRGAGGGTLGAAIGWTLRPVAAEPMTWFRLRWEDRAGEALWRLVQALEAAPERMGSKVSLIAGPRPALVVIGQLRGKAAEVADLLDPVGTATHREVVETTYWAAQDALSEAGLPNRYQETSHFAGRMPHAMVEEALRHCARWPGTGGEADFKMFHVGGRIRAVAPDATAYVHRQAEWIMGTELTWAAGDVGPRLDRALAWQRGFHDAITRIAGGPGGSFQNFPDPGLIAPAEAYYGANLPRLAALKRRLDPDNLFAPPRGQGIVG